MILSALHGLVDAKQIIAPYQHYLDELNHAEQKEWAKRVLTGLRDILESGDKVIFLVGKIYRQDLLTELESRGIQIEIPMEGVEIGKMCGWLANQLAPRTEPAAQLELI